MLRVLAIDPGMKHTGVALVDELGVSCATTIGYTQPVYTDRDLMCERCRSITERLRDLLTEWPHDVVVLEQFDIHFEGKGKAMTATQGIFLESWLLGNLLDDEPEVHLQTPLEVFSPNLERSIYWYLGTRKKKAKTKEDELRALAEFMPGGYNCHGERDQIQAAAHGLKYVYDHHRLFEI